MAEADEEAFFRDPTVEDVVLSTVQRVDDLTDVQQRKLLKTFKRTRRELLDRLLTVREGTFTEQQLNVTLVQVEAAIETIKRDLKDEMFDSSEVLGLQGVKDLISEIKRFSKKFEGSVQPIAIEPTVVAEESQNFLINKYEASIDAYGAGLRSQITQNIISSMAIRDTNQRTVGRLVADIGRFFVGEEWKLSRIVRTEMSNIYNFAKINGMRDIRDEFVPDLKKALLHPMDHRTGDDSKQLARKNPVVDIDKPFVFTFKRKLKSGEVREERREFMFPPDRPNDRAVLISFRDEWGKRAAGFTPGG